MKPSVYLIPFIFYVVCNCDDEFCELNSKYAGCKPDSSSAFNSRYIFYDVNPPEGFNLRRDVYMRMAIFARKLHKKHEDWHLVLPPWPHLYHWQSQDILDQNRLPWSLFFDIETLSSFAPVIEMSLFLETKQTVIDQVYVLQHFEDTFTSGNFNDRFKIEPCQNQLKYVKKKGDLYSGYFWGYSNITAKSVECLSFHGHASQLIDFLENVKGKTIMFDHAEIVLHDRFGDKTYWNARKSMTFADHLVKEAAKFRRNELNSTDETDLTFPSEERKAVGGNYLCVHLRRKDFAIGRSKEVPSIKGASEQIRNALNDLKLDTVFVATDAPPEEKKELKSYLSDKNVVMFKPSSELKKKYKDGGIAIIEQIICSRARKFIGTHESTFSFRIQEEREILGFPPETTFSRLCGDNEKKCKQPSQWKIEH